MKIIYSAKKMYFNIAIFLFLLFSYTSSGLTFIYIGPTRLLSLALAVFLTVIACKFKISKTIDYGDFFLILSVLFVVFNNANLKKSDIGYVIAYLCIVLFYFFASRTDVWINAFLNILLIMGLFFAFFTIVSYLNRDFYVQIVNNLYPKTAMSLLFHYDNGCISGITNNYSANGIYLSIGLCVSFYTFMFSKKENISSLRRKFSFLVFAICFLSLLLTGKRGPTIFAVFSLFLVYYFYYSNNKKGRLIKIIGVLILGITLIFIIAQFVPEINTIFNRFEQTKASGDISLGRLERIKLAFELFFKNPIFGMGWDSFKYYYSTYPAAKTGSLIINVHNVYAQLLCEVGLVGFFIFIAIFIINLKKAFKTYINCRKDNVNFKVNASKALAVAVYIQIFFLLYGLTGNPLYDTEMLFPYLMSCAIVQYYYKNFKTT